MDLSDGPLVVAGLFKTCDGDLLLIAIHHLVVDGVSWRILLEDFATAYRQLEKKEAVKLPEKTDSFKYWAEQLTEYAAAKNGALREADYWREIGGTDISPLPVDHVISDAQKKDKHFRSIAVQLDEKETDALLKEVHQAYGTEINDILLTALGFSLSQWSGNSKIAVHLEGHGRESILEDVDITRTVGWFTSQYPIILDMAMPEGVAAAERLAYGVKQTKETLRRIPNKGVGYGLLEYMTPPELRGDGVFKLKPEVSFNYLGQLGGEKDADTGLIRLSSLDSGDNVSPDAERLFALDINGSLMAGKLRMSFSYNQYQYDESTVRGLAEDFKGTLVAVIEHCSGKEEREFTPSDLGCGTLSLGQLEQMETHIGERVRGNGAIERAYPLSPMQGGMLYHWIKSQPSDAYFEQSTISIEGEMDGAVLTKSFNALINRYDILRTLFYYDGLDEPIQAVLTERRVEIGFEDIGAMGEHEKEEYLEKFKEADRSRGFDLTADPLMRGCLFKMDHHWFKLVWSFHHILMDGWCLGLIFEEMLQYYEAFNWGSSLRLERVTPYVEYIRWLERMDKEAGLKLWREYLDDFEHPTGLPLPAKVAEETAYRPEEYCLELNEVFTAGLNGLAASGRVTLNTVFQVLWGLLLHRYNNTDDAVFGAVVSGRPAEIEGIERMVGLFINTVPVRVKVQEDYRGIGQLLQAVHDETAALKSVEYLPLAEIQAGSLLKRELLDHIVAFENYPVQEEVKKSGLKEGLGFRVTEVTIREHTDYPLNIMVVPGSKLQITLGFNGFVYETSYIRRVAGHLEMLIRQVTEEPGKLLEDLEIVTPEERERLLVTFNEPGRDRGYPGDRTIHWLFEEQVERTPDGVALAGFAGNGQDERDSLYLTYSRLNSDADALADVLRDRGVERGDIVALLMERSVDMLVGIMGILKAGAAYLPIDSGYPDERISYMLADCAVSLMVTHESLYHNRFNENSFDDKAQGNISQGLPQILNPLEIIFLANGAISNLSVSPKPGTSPKAVQSGVQGEPPPGARRIGAPGGPPEAHDPAYIIYTSGTTGRPKGNVTRHFNVVRVVRGTNYIEMGEGDNLLQLSNYAFDGSVFDIYGALLNGAGLVLVRGNEVSEPDGLAQLILREHVTVFFVTTALFNALVDLRLDCFAYIRKILFGGERVSVEHSRRALEFMGKGRILHVYGPTETTVYATYFPIDEIEEGLTTIPIGYPLANTTLYILDRHNRLTPEMAPGEVYIGGAGVAAGYLNKPELTAEKFVSLPVPPAALRGRLRGGRQGEAPPGPPIARQLGTGEAYGLHSHGETTTLAGEGMTFYRTGDLGRWLRDGSVEFMGRIDQQVKIRGFRIEPGEIEYRLRELEEIQEAVIVPGRDDMGTTYLCAYIVRGEGYEERFPGFAQLREALSETMPDYMVPAYFVTLDKIPLTPNGKLDRRALPEPTLEKGETYVAPRNEIERELAGIWADVLKMPRQESLRRPLRGERQGPPTGDGVKAPPGPPITLGVGSRDQRMELGTTSVETGEHLIGINEDFFQLGGHSLKATMLAAKIHRAFDVKIPLADIFENPTIKGMAGYIKEASKERYSHIARVDEMEFYPLSSAQKRLVFLWEMDKGGTGYNMPQAVVLDGRLDVEKLDGVFHDLIHRHESLRTSFHMVRGDGGEFVPRQRVHKKIDFSIVFSEATDIPFVDGAYCVDALMVDFVRAFDLTQAPLLRVGLARLEKEKHVLMLDMHHIITDGASQAVLVEEFMALYNGDILEPLTIRYRDFSNWQNSAPQQALLRDQKNYWLGLLSEDRQALELPLDFPRPAVKGFEGGYFATSLDSTLTSGLRALAREADATLFMSLTALFNILLAKLSRQEDIIIGTPIAGRRHESLERVVGMFVNTLALRNEPVGEKSFRGFLHEVKNQTLKAFENQDYPFEALVDDLSVIRDTGRNPIFDVVLVLQNVEAAEMRIPGLALLPCRYEERIAKFDLTFTVVEKEEELSFTFEYSSDIFREETVRRFARYLEAVVSAAVNDRGVLIADIDILSEEEKEKLLHTWNDTAAGYPEGKTIHGLFEEQVARVPERIAVLTAGVTGEDEGQNPFTYEELNTRANAVAWALMERGVGRDTIVGMLLEPCNDMLTAIFGILKAGGAYMPIDPAYPTDRKNYMLTDSGTSLLITTNKLESTISINNEIITLEKILTPPTGEEIPGGSVFPEHRTSPIAAQSGVQGEPPPGAARVGPPGGPPEASSLAYIIYTSGTTGKPKGAMIEHGNVVRLMFNDGFRFDFGECDTWTMFHSYCFDFSVWEMYGALLYGGKLVVVPKMAAVDTGRYLEILEEYGVTVLNQTPSAFYNLITEEEKREEARLGLRYVIFGGEALKPGKLKTWRQRYPGTILVNMFGITETTVHVTYKEIGEAEIEGNISNVGGPIPTTTVYVVDKQLNLSPTGTAGELLVGGDGVGRGYLNRPELTAEKFVADTGGWGDGGFLYRSGDLGRWLRGGELEYLGRIDFQVKIRGFRIELGEIETRLLQREDIKEAIVLARPDSSGINTLCAYIVYDVAEELQRGTDELRDYLSETLPAYMIPSFFVTMERIPLTSNGKVDRRALPEPEAQLEDLYIAPATETEERLAGIFERLFSVSPVGVNDDFFRLGGDSLKAMTAVTAIHKELNVKVPLVEFFKMPTVKGLAEYIGLAEADKYVSIPVAEKRPYYRLSSAQKRLFILAQMDPGATGYNMPQFFVLEKSGQLDKDKWEGAFKQLIQRHESLRTSFHIIDEVPVQKVSGAEAVSFELEYFDIWADEAAGDSSGAKVKGILDGFVRPFDLTEAPLLRAGLVTVSPERHIFMLDMHHLVTDGVSQMVLLEEFTAFYTGGDVPALGLHYKDYAEWRNSETQQAAAAKQEHYWLGIFGGDVPVLELPTDYSRPQMQRFEGGAVNFRVDGAVVEGMNRIAREVDATLFMTGLSLFYLLLSRLSRQEDVVVGTPTAGRRHKDIERTVGMFVNTLAVRAYPAGEKPFREFLLEVKEACLEAFEHQEYPFEELVDKLSLRRDTGRNPLFDVMFSLSGGGAPAEAERLFNMRPYEYESTVAKFDLTLDGVVVEDQWAFSLSYCWALFTEERVRRFGGYFSQIAASIGGNGDITLAEIEILPQEEKEQLLFGFNDTAVGYPSDKTLPEVFHEQVERTGDAIALQGLGLRPHGEIEQVGYNELYNRSLQLASLLRERGVKEGDIVALLVPRTVDMMVAIMGIWMTGAAYLPLDPEHPQERLTYMLADSCAEMLLTSHALPEELSVNDLTTLCRSLYLEDIYSSSHNGSVSPEHRTSSKAVQDGGPGARHAGGVKASPLRSPRRRPRRAAGGTELAYVIYTSGSTGKPKGVMIPHRGLLNFIKGILDEVPLKKGDVVLSLTTISFDIFGLETHLPLTMGARVIMGSEREQVDPALVAGIFRRENVNLFQATPSRLQMLMNEPEAAEALEVLAYLLVGGEAFPAPLLAAARERVKGRIVNVYGPTETTIWSTIKDLTGDVPLDIGKPIANTQIYILDKYDRCQPLGVPGELCIGGDGLALGYVNRPVLTAERFCAFRTGASGGPPGGPTRAAPGGGSPWTPVQISRYENLPGFGFYRTGDLARWLPDGNIEFLGRLDYQVKIRGFRVELGEIENRLTAHETIDEAAVIIKENEEGDKFISAFFVPAVAVETEQEQQEPSATVLKEYLSQKLPYYMVPTYFTPLDALPLTPNGKINRKALHGFEEGQMKAESLYVAPSGPVETQVAEIWQDVLNLEQVGVTDDFFESGGDSLKAITAAGRIQKTFSVSLTLGQFFNHPTIKKLALFIAGQAKERVYEAIEKTEPGEFYRLSSAQKRLYILNRLEPQSLGYNLPGAVILEGTPDIPGMEKALRGLIERHESLRTSFRMAEGNPVQVIHGIDEIDFKIDYEPWSGLRRLSEGPPGGPKGGAPWDPIKGASDLSRSQGEQGLIGDDRERTGPVSIDGIAASFIRPFNLSEAPLLRAGMFKLEEGRYLLVLDIHHIVYDGSSTAVFLRELTALYRGEQLPPLSIQYKDYAEWQNGERQITAVKNQEAYWLERFKGEIPLLNLPLDFPRPAVQVYDGSTVVFEIGANESEALTKLAQSQQSTLFMILLAIYNILLSRLSRQEDIIVGAPVAGRKHPDLQNLIGIFLNTLALRNHPAASKSFGEFLKEVKTGTLDAFDNQDYPFENLVEQVVARRDLSRNPLFDVMFSLHNEVPVHESYEEESYGLTIKTYRLSKKASQFDMTFEGMEADDGRLVFKIDYCTGLFKEETVERFAGYFKEVVSSVLAEPGRKLAEVEILPRAEKKKLLIEFNDTALDYGADSTIHGLIEEQALRTPDSTAVMDGGKGAIAAAKTGETESYTYRQLDDVANGLCNRLKAHGAGQGVFVAVLLNRSIDLMAVLLAVLKTGAAYLPLDPEYPEARIAYILENSNAAMVLTGQQGSETCRQNGFTGTIILCQDLTTSPGNNQNTEHIKPISNLSVSPTHRRSPKAVQSGVQGEPPPGARRVGAPGGPPEARNLAYVIYTSGSTGNPKGVAIAHYNVVNFIGGMRERIDFGVGKTILALTTVSFDIFLLETLLPLTCGMRVAVADAMVQKDPGLLKKAVRALEIDMMQVTPSRLQLLLGVDEALTCLAGVDTLMVGGEAFPGNLLGKVQAVFKGRIFNMYGPTETTIWSAVKELTKTDPASITIGGPIANTQLVIVDHSFGLQPLGVGGELLIGGDGVGAGYLNNLGLTTEKFIKTPPPLVSAFAGLKGEAVEESVDERIRSGLFYRTGDLARWLPSGEVEFLGRMDYQVKIRGFRIELDEIEEQLTAHEKIKESVVTAGEHPSGEKFLCAYYIPTTGIDGGPDIAELRRFLGKSLPGYMIPSYFMPLETFPLTPNGKIDKKALRKVGDARPALGTVFAAPTSGKEKQVAEAWKEVLQVEKIGVDDNFFELGGNSLNIIQLNNLLNETLNEEIEVVTMFTYPTIRSFITHIEAGPKGETFSKKEEKSFEDRKRGKSKLQERRKRRR